MATEVSTIERPEHRAIADDVLFEVIDGALVEKPPMGTRQQILASKLQTRLENFANSWTLGWVVTETLFDFTEQVGRKRRPDVAFVSYDRWPPTKVIPDADGWDVVPNLAVEVVSPSNSWDELMEKVQEYFRVGVERVWVVSPSQRQVHVFESAASVRILSAEDELADESLLPGFRLALAEIFSQDAANRPT